VDVVAVLTANVALLLKVAEAMAPRRHRKVVPFPGILPNMAAVLVAVIGMATLSYIAWRAWPVLSHEWKARIGGTLFSQAGRGDSVRSSGVSAESHPDSPAHLKGENRALLEENRLLRDQLQRTSESLARKSTELDDLKLRLLIREKTRPGP
jgi:hypothetical protein